MAAISTKALQMQEQLTALMHKQVESSCLRLCSYPVVWFSLMMIVVVCLTGRCGK